MHSRREFLSVSATSALAVLSSACRRASDSETHSNSDPVASFREYLSRHLASYRTNNRHRVTLLGGGWVQEYFEPDGEPEIDVQTTNSLVSPYLGIGQFALRTHVTPFRKSRSAAVADTTSSDSWVVKHRHTYTYQRGIWVPKTRQHYSTILDQWTDCNEASDFGENKGATNSYGCFEETS